MFMAFSFLLNFKWNRDCHLVCLEYHSGFRHLKPFLKNNKKASNSCFHQEPDVTSHPAFTFLFFFNHVCLRCLLMFRARGVSNNRFFKNGLKYSQSHIHPCVSSGNITLFCIKNLEYLQIYLWMSCIYKV